MNYVFKLAQICHLSRRKNPSKNTPTALPKSVLKTPSYRALALWVVLLLLGFSSLFRYEFAGAAPTGAPTTLPAALQSEQASTRPTLLFFAHPRCPCTAAAIAELDRVLSDFPDTFNTMVLFPRPAGAPEDWIAGPNHESAKRLPGAVLREDSAARLTDLFQAAFSGTALLYDDTGKLVFHGGLTASRGHEGTNFGALALRAVAKNNTPRHTTTPVFGCPLRQPTHSEDLKALE